MADPPRQDDATRSLLLEQFAVEQFLLGLSLVDRFLLDVLIVPTPRVARAVLALLRDELPARRAEPLDVRVFAPDPAKASALDPVEASALVADVLTPLLQPAEPTAGRMTLTWVDASDARAIDDEAWTEFFHRLNERRNAVVESQPGPLVLVLPYRLERTLAHAAPDVWSVRSGVYRVQVVDLETHVFDVETERHRPIGVAHAADTAPRSLTLAIALTGEEPARFDDKTRAWAFSESVSGLLQEGRLDEAEAVARASLDRARKAVTLSPRSKETLHTLARSLDGSASIADILGRWSDFQDRVRERLRVIDQIIGDESPTGDLLAMRAKARARLSLLLKTEDLDVVRAGVSDARRLVAEEGSHASLHLLADCLVLAAGLDLANDDPTSAIAKLDESVALIENTGDSQGQSLQTMLLEIEARLQRARSLSWLDRHADAAVDARIALDRAKTFQQQARRPLDGTRMVVLAWQNLAAIFRAQGDLVRAEEGLAEFRQTAASLFRALPQSVRAASLYISALRESAEVAREIGSLEQASAWIAEALDLTGELLRRSPDDEVISSQRTILVTLQHHLQPPTDPT